MIQTFGLITTPFVTAKEPSVLPLRGNWSALPQKEMKGESAQCPCEQYPTKEASFVGQKARLLICHST